MLVLLTVAGIICGYVHFCSNNRPRKCGVKSPYSHFPSTQIDSTSTCYRNNSGIVATSSQSRRYRTRIPARDAFDNWGKHLSTNSSGSEPAVINIWPRPPNIIDGFGSITDWVFHHAVECNLVRFSPPLESVHPCAGKNRRRFFLRLSL